MQPAARVALISSLATVFVVVVIGGGGYLFYTSFLSKWIRDYQTTSEANAILDEVGKVVLLPADETPQVTKIIDADQLKSGDHFFDAAKNGDAAIFYQKSGMLILFDLQNDKLLNMGTLATGTPSGDAASASPPPAQTSTSTQNH